jgi:dipeptide/tripeptide permease
MMDSRLWGDTLLLPDQMTTLNAVLILLFIPIFQVVIYPLVSCCFKITLVFCWCLAMEICLTFQSLAQNGRRRHDCGLGLCGLGRRTIPN